VRGRNAECGNTTQEWICWICAIQHLKHGIVMRVDAVVG
jgi:hypothetical protein